MEYFVEGNACQIEQTILWTLKFNNHVCKSPTLVRILKWSCLLNSVMRDLPSSIFKKYRYIVLQFLSVTARSSLFLETKLGVNDIQYKYFVE